MRKQYVVAVVMLLALGVVFNLRTCRSRTADPY